MFFASDSWLGLAIVVIIGVVVVGLATCMGTLIIWLFGTGHEAAVTSDKDRATVRDTTLAVVGGRNTSSR